MVVLAAPADGDAPFPAALVPVAEEIPGQNVQ